MGADLEQLLAPAPDPGPHVMMAIGPPNDRNAVRSNRWSSTGASRCAIQTGERQHPLPDREIGGGEISSRTSPDGTKAIPIPVPQTGLGGGSCPASP
jgi:hypothetical protein